MTTPVQRPGKDGLRFNGSRSTCSFCLLVFSLPELSKDEAKLFLSHLRQTHGLKVGEIER